MDPAGGLLTGGLSRAGGFDGLVVEGPVVLLEQPTQTNAAARVSSGNVCRSFIDEFLPEFVPSRDPDNEEMRKR